MHLLKYNIYIILGLLVSYACSTNNEETTTENESCTSEIVESLSATDFNMTFMSDQTANIISDGTTFESATNPDSENTINSSCNVAKVSKTNTVAWDNIQIDLDSKLQFIDHAGLSIKVYAAVPGFKVLVKLESISNPANFIIKEITTTKTEEWETLEFLFSSNDSGKYDKIILIFDVDTASTNTYYFDDFTYYGTGDGILEGSGTGGEPVIGDIVKNGTFETGDLTNWTAYTNGGTIIADNTENNAGDWSAKIVATSTGMNPTLKQIRMGTLSVGDTFQVTFDFKGSLTGVSGAYSLQCFVEGANGVNQTEIFQITPIDTWQSFTQTYTVNEGDLEGGGITLEFTAICGGFENCSSTLYLDNISAVINP